MDLSWTFTEVQSREASKKINTGQHAKTSLTDAKKLLPAPSVEIRLHHASRWLTFSPFDDSAIDQPGLSFPRRPSAGKGFAAAPSSCGPTRARARVQARLVPGLRCEGLREAPASVPGLGRDPGRHEAGGLGAAPRRGQGEAAARRRGTRTTAAPGPPGCGDERGGGGGWRINRGDCWQDGGCGG